ncbi:MAG: MFS transporter [Betaproteobacteria bacterium]|nr:MFS transporter [Betaproteobacteria bacterium]
MAGPANEGAGSARGPARSTVKQPSVAPMLLARYAALALPLAMAALPVYVYVPKLYADEGGMGLAVVGTVLLITRAFDAIQDPVIGWWSDRAAVRAGGRSGALVASVALLGVGVLGLFHPPGWPAGAGAAWLATCLVVTYLGFSIGTINYFAMGAEISDDYHQRTRVTATRSAAGVAGVLLAAVLPEVFGGDRGLAHGLATFSLVFTGALVAGAFLTTFGVPPSARVQAAARGTFSWRAIGRPLANRHFRWLLATFVASGVASAIPATLILFYVQDLLGRADLNGVFLCTYFAFAALGMPLWVRASRRLGKKGAWLLGMAMSIGAFVWAFLLGPGDVGAFAVVCALSGIAYGAELAIPPSLLADVAATTRSGPDGTGDASYFGFWQLAEKANLALAAGFALPVLALAGYRPGDAQAAMGDLSAMYALVPCLIKSGALAVLWLSPVDSAGAGQPRPSNGEFR